LKPEFEDIITNETVMATGGLNMYNKKQKKRHLLAFGMTMQFQQFQEEKRN